MSPASAQLAGTSTGVGRAAGDVAQHRRGTALGAVDAGGHRGARGRAFAVNTDGAGEAVRRSLGLRHSQLRTEEAGEAEQHCGCKTSAKPLESFAHSVCSLLAVRCGLKPGPFPAPAPPRRGREWERLRTVLLDYDEVGLAVGERVEVVATRYVGGGREVAFPAGGGQGPDGDHALGSAVGGSASLSPFQTTRLLPATRSLDHVAGGASGASSAASPMASVMVDWIR